MSVLLTCFTDSVKSFFTLATLDYRDREVSLIFPPCQSIACAEISIVDDSVMELLEETFIVSLHIENADPGVRISHQPSTVIISDNDGLYTSIYVISYYLSLSLSNMQLSW